MPNVKDNDREALNTLNTEITKFCNIKNLENKITKNIAEYTSISLKLYGILKFIVQEREGQKSKFRDEILRLKVLDFTLMQIKEGDQINHIYINNLKQHQKFIESCAELKGGCFSVWGSKIKKALKKFNKIDMLTHIKTAIFNDGVDSIIKKYKEKLPKIEEIEKQVDDFYKNCNYKIDDAKKYLGIAKNFRERTRMLYKIINIVLKIKIDFEATLKTIPDLDIFKQDGTTILQHLAKIGLWFQSIKNYEVGQKNIKVANTMAEIDVKKFKTDIESKKIDEEEKERIQKEKEEKEEKERIQKEKEEKEEKYKENLPKEIEKHKSLIEKIIKKLEQFKDIKYKGKQLKIGDYKGEYDVLKGEYSELINKITVIKTNEKENGIEIVQFLRSIQKKIEIFSNLNQNKPQEKSMFEFSDNSITDKDDRFKTIYTLKDNNLTLEIYDRDKLSSKITVE